MVKTKQKLSKFKNKKTIIISILLVLTIGIASYFTYNKVIWYNDVANTTSVVSIREMVIRSMDILKTPAPIDAKTGNIYFPQAKLYLPESKDTLNQQLLYSYYYDGQQSEFSVTSKVTMNMVEAKSYSARNLNEFFDQVPHMQACNRGIVVSYKQLSKDETGGKLRQTVHLNNGKTLYIYSEDACPELYNPDLNDTVAQLKNLQAY